SDHSSVCFRTCASPRIGEAKKKPKAIPASTCFDPPISSSPKSDSRNYAKGNRRKRRTEVFQCFLLILKAQIHLTVSQHFSACQSSVSTRNSLSVFSVLSCST